MDVQKLIHLPVFTESGKKLGKVHIVDIDPSAQKIEKYYVYVGGLVEGLFRDQLIIHHRQVVKITEEKMVVEDSVIREPEPRKSIRLAKT